MRKEVPSPSDSRIAIAELSTKIESIDHDYQDLRSAVLGLGKRIDDLGSSINAKIDQRSQPQWQTYIAGAMLLGGMFFAFIAPIQDTNRNQDNALRDLVGEHRKFVKDVGDELTRRNDIFVTVRTHDDLVKRIDRDEAYSRSADTDLKALIANVSRRLTNAENNTEARRLNSAILDELKATNHTIFEMLKPK
jgi:septal ring factor EnvC (AmiA/AmiB activator)